MTSTNTTTPNTVSVTNYLNLVPTATIDKYSTEEIRNLILDYLCNSCYLDSAKSFAREVQLRNEFDKNTSITSTTTSTHSNGSNKTSNGNGIKESNGNGNGKESKRLSTIRNDERSNNHNNMEGIESTPEPQFQSEVQAEVIELIGNDIEMDATMEEVEVEGLGNDNDDDELEDELEVESTLRSSNGSSNGGTNGKAVAFHDEIIVEDDEEEEESWPGLSKEDLRLVKLRRDIRDDILNGRIQKAVDSLTEHFPTVLSESISPSSPPVEQCLPTTFFISSSSSPASNQDSTSLIKNQLPILGTKFINSALNLSPLILNLNLQLQSFVELIRTANSTTSSSTPSTPPQPTHDSPNPNNNNMSSSTSSILSSKTSSMIQAISHSQALGAKVKKMTSSKIKEDWEKECIDVSGLMAYTDLSICPVRGYLSQERREILAELINSAVLQSLNKTPMPILNLAVRQTTTIWNALAEWKVNFPPSSSNSNAAGKALKVVKTVGNFNLKTFLQEGDSPVLENGNGVSK